MIGQGTIADVVSSNIPNVAYRAASGGGYEAARDYDINTHLPNYQPVVDDSFKATYNFSHLMFSMGNMSGNFHGASGGFAFNKNIGEKVTGKFGNAVFSVGGKEVVNIQEDIGSVNNEINFHMTKNDAAEKTEPAFYVTNRVKLRVSSETVPSFQNEGVITGDFGAGTLFKILSSGGVGVYSGSMNVTNSGTKPVAPADPCMEGAGACFVNFGPDLTPP
jgi:hypothetical protein